MVLCYTIGVRGAATHLPRLHNTMPDVTKPSTAPNPPVGRMWLVTGNLVDAIWRPSWVLLHVEIPQAEADAINATVRALAQEAFPGSDVEDVESPVIHIGKRLCLKVWGRSVQTIRNKDDEELVSVKAGAKISIKVALRPYRDPVRGLRVTAFPGRIDVLRAAAKAKKPPTKKEQAEVGAKNVADCAAAKAPTPPAAIPAPKPVKARKPKTVTAPRLPTKAELDAFLERNPEARPGADIIPFPASSTRH